MKDVGAVQSLRERLGDVVALSAETGMCWPEIHIVDLRMCVAVLSDWVDLHNGAQEDPETPF